jgi:hypothetical protein
MNQVNKGKQQKDEIYFDFDVEMETYKDTGLLLDLPLRNNLKAKKGKGSIKSFGSIPRFKSVEGKKCLLLEPRIINLFKDFDVPIEIKPNTYYSINIDTVKTIKVEWLIDQIIESTIDTNKPFLSPPNSSYLSIPPFKNPMNHQIQIEEGYINSESYTKTIKKSNIISIPTYGNINSRDGILEIEIYPNNLNSNKKQYLFNHGAIQYPTSTIAIWIEDRELYIHDINGINKLTSINIKDKQWNKLRIDFKGSIYTADQLHIGDFLNNFNGYIRNFKIFKKL